jgi:tripartite-type tricarboxylate transporter receptor subunit TctC
LSPDAIDRHLAIGLDVPIGHGETCDDDLAGVSAWTGLFAPKDTPPEIVAKLSEGVREVLAEPEIRSRLADIGFETQWIGPAEFAKHVKDDMELWATTTREAGIERQ